MLPQGALLLSKVLKEREAQIELKQRIKSASEDVDKCFTDMQKKKDKEALKQEQDEGLQKKLEKQMIAEDLKQKYGQTHSSLLLFSLWRETAWKYAFKVHYSKQRNGSQVLYKTIFTACEHFNESFIGSRKGSW